MMHRFISLLIATLAATLSASAFAAAPSALYNKSVTASWSEARSMKDVDDRARHRVISHTMGIYVSSNGRVFMQTSRIAHVRGNRAVNSKGSSISPDGVIKTANSVASRGREISMSGRSIVEMVKFESGARRVEISFDEGFRSCSLKVQYGKDGDTPIVARGMNTRLHAVTSISVASEHCAIRDGNMFGE